MQHISKTVHAIHSTFNGTFCCSISPDGGGFFWKELFFFFFLAFCEIREWFLIAKKGVSIGRDILWYVGESFAKLLQFALFLFALAYVSEDLKDL